MNRGDGTFRDEALLRGAAFDDSTVHLGLEGNTPFVGWGCAFLDADNDGWRDVLLVNGHVFPEVESLPDSDLQYKERPVLYRDLQGERFIDISLKSGPGIQQHRAARGMAVADIDNDGRIEALVIGQNEVPAMLAQRGSIAGNWILLDLEGTVSNRSAIGPRVMLQSPGSKQTGEVRGGGSYLSQNGLRLHFGLGPDATANIEIRWPLGGRQTLRNLEAGRVHEIREPQRSH